jgi:hypothetical protein
MEELALSCDSIQNFLLFEEQNSIPQQPLKALTNN